MNPLVSPMLEDKPLPPVHPVFGRAKETAGLDGAAEAAIQPSGLKEVVLEWFGDRRPAPRPATPIRRNLQVDQTELQWSGGSSRYGYGYVSFCRPGGPPLPLWEFAPCSKTSLVEIASEDLAPQFISFSDRTNRSAVCRAAFGTNWLRNAIRVSQGRIILARLAGDQTRVYALEFARQSMTNATVFYLEVPPSTQLTNRMQ